MTIVPNQFSKGSKVQLLPFYLFWIDLVHCEPLTSGCAREIEGDSYRSLLVEIMKLGISILVISALVVLQRIFYVHVKNILKRKNTVKIEFVTQEQVAIGLVRALCRSSLPARENHAGRSRKTWLTTPGRMCVLLRGVCHICSCNLVLESPGNTFL